jgi:hypothetical protein
LQEAPAGLQQQLAASLQARRVCEQRADVLAGVKLTGHERYGTLDKHLQQQRPAYQGGGQAGRRGCGCRKQLLTWVRWVLMRKYLLFGCVHSP